ncbi:hypothetical protein NUW54_g10230 [Trametes sanguinea]|uniref:Uncharacterized protein n=1 Tax=Trametes sanguinea TaxID=158606 RepID=A0ACC1P107_9APHY|nr:hypothetical protein NUW54_g10230 [Trametes sanguinea]
MHRISLSSYSGFVPVDEGAGMETHANVLPLNDATRRMVAASFLFRASRSPHCVDLTGNAHRQTEHGSFPLSEPQGNICHASRLLAVLSTQHASPVELDDAGLQEHSIGMILGHYRCSEPVVERLYRTAASEVNQVTEYLLPMTIMYVLGRFLFIPPAFEAILAVHFQSVTEGLPPPRAELGEHGRESSLNLLSSSALAVKQAALLLIPHRIPQPSYELPLKVASDTSPTSEQHEKSERSPTVYLLTRYNGAVDSVDGDDSPSNLARHLLRRQQPNAFGARVTIASSLHAFAAIEESPHAFFKACRDAHLKPIYKPFWAELPFVDIFLTIPPDILHQLYQGIIKHLLSWIKQAYGAAEIDARCRRMPPNHNARHFHKGISTLSRLTGGEHSDICRILLGLIIDLPLPDGRSPVRLVRAVRGMLDFLYLAQYPVHTKQTLDLMEGAMRLFHQNKVIFVDLGIRAAFNFPKLHSATSHYVSAILRLGTADNFNTEYTERLHIDLAKLAYRSTNRKDEFMQMTVWLERKEKILQHERYVAWRALGDGT